MLLSFGEKMTKTLDFKFCQTVLDTLTALRIISYIIDQNKNYAYREKELRL